MSHIGSGQSILKFRDSFYNNITTSLFNPFIPSGLFHLNSLERSVSYNRGCLVSFYYHPVCRNVRISIMQIV